MTVLELETQMLVLPPRDRIHLAQRLLDSLLSNELSDKVDEVDFFSYAGMWKERNVSAEAIRQQAWPNASE